jgi:HAD superfamily hydrolase (TIGR01509 family)
MQIRGVEAIIFDMDGTLVDSEGLADVVIAAFLRDHGVPRPRIEHARFHGLTWERIAAILSEDHPHLAGDTFADELGGQFQAAFVSESPPLVDGAHEAILAAADHFPAALAIASSSNRVSVEHLVARLGLGEVIPVRICAEDCRRAKPDPECYLKAASSLGLAPKRCLVFEDSLPGLGAARASGARTVAITRGKTAAQLEEVRPLVDLCVEDFTALPPNFFGSIKAPGAS